jgi:hypothetical protein
MQALDDVRVAVAGTADRLADGDGGRRQDCGGVDHESGRRRPGSGAWQMRSGGDDAPPTPWAADYSWKSV